MSFLPILILCWLFRITPEDIEPDEFHHYGRRG